MHPRIIFLTALIMVWVAQPLKAWIVQADQPVWILPLVVILHFMQIIGVAIAVALALKLLPKNQQGQ